MSNSQIPAATLSARILSGDLPPAAAMGRADAYDLLNRGKGGRLPFLGSSSKVEHGEGFGVLSAVLYMMPADSSGREACPHRSDGCTAACLVRDTGKMNFPNAIRSRARRHASFYADRNRFLADLHSEIVKHARKATRMGKVPAIRLNGTTDLPWHRMAFTAADGTRYASLHAATPSVRYYEYTKVPLSIAAKGGLPANLHLTFSVNERADSDSRAAEYLQAGYGAAVVFATKRHVHPATFTVGGHTAPVVDGDAHDARFLDPKGSIVSLSAKGRAKRDASGFVRNPTPSV